MGTKTEERRCGGCRSFVSECECDYEQCEECERHVYVCDCDEVAQARFVASVVDPDVNYTAAAREFSVDRDILERIHRAMLNGED
jgi:hypothetical protein